MLSRIKFEITPLVNDMLDRLPAAIWTSKNTRFFDPAIAGGQFVREIERRLLAAGHSKTNVAGRVFGCEEYEHQIQYALNKYQLLGNYTVMDFLEHDFADTQFDVIVGSPRFQASTDHGKKTTGNGALWVKYTIKALELLKDGGHLGFVIPDSWTAPTYDLMGSRESIFNDYFKKYNLHYVNFDVKKYFSSIGIDPSAFVLTKTSNYTSTTTKLPSGSIDFDITKMSFIPKDVSAISLSIHSKILNNTENKRLFKMRWKKTVTSIETRNNKDAIFKYPFVDCHSYKPMRWASALDPDSHLRKVLVPYVGKYQCIIDNVGELGARESVSVLFLKDTEVGRYAENFFTSNLINFVMNTNRWTQYQLSQILNFIPVEDFTKNWTDITIYKHFKLTKEEIAYIEAIVNA